MIEVVRFRLLVDGHKGEARWEVPADAHPLGVTPAHGSRHWRMGDDLGTPDGALKCALYSRAALDAALEELDGAWSTPALPGL